MDLQRQAPVIVGTGVSAVWSGVGEDMVMKLGFEERIRKIGLRELQDYNFGDKIWNMKETPGDTYI